MRCPGRVGWSLALALAVTGTPLRGAGSDPVVHTAPAVFHPAGERPVQSLEAFDAAAAAARLPASARHALPPLSADERARLNARDAGVPPLRTKRPAQRVGIVRLLPSEVGFRGLPADLPPGSSRPWGGGLMERAADGRFVWTTSLSSEGAAALRLHVREALLPPGSRVDIFGSNGEAHGPYAFDSATRDEGFWTHTVFSPQVLARAEMPSSAAAGPAEARLFFSSLAHLEPPAAAERGGRKPAALTPQSDTCFVDASCVAASEFPGIDSASRAVGQLNFVDTDGAFICSGGLLNTTTTAFVPYVLTANHCFSTQAAASSLEVFWDYKTPSCGAPAPSESAFPRTLGSTLLATNETSDFTLVQLSQPPPDGSVFLGWTTADYSHADGTLIHRLSYPDARPQIYSRHQIQGSPDIVCSDKPQGNYLYSRDVRGGTGGGSSGSPAYLASLEVVGQLLGACGTNPNDDCDSANNLTLDGAFRASFPSLSQWLAPAAPGPCAVGPSTMCLHGARFRVTAHWTKATGESGDGTGVTLTDDSGYFWFFAASNIELVVKVLDACSGFQHFWVFGGGLTDVQVRLTVEDTASGAVRIYDNAQGTAFPPLQDTQAFSCP